MFSWFRAILADYILAKTVKLRFENCVVSYKLCVCTPGSLILGRALSPQSSERLTGGHLRMRSNFLKTISSIIL